MRCARVHPVLIVWYRVIAMSGRRTHHGVQPSTGGSKAGSTPTYNCGARWFPPSPRPSRGVAPESEGWRGSGCTGGRFDDRGGTRKGDRTGRRERQRNIGTKGKRGRHAKAAAGRLHAPTPTTARVAPVRHPSHSCGLLACLLACLLALPVRFTPLLGYSWTPWGVCPLPALPFLLSLRPMFTVAHSSQYSSLSLSLFLSRPPSRSFYLCRDNSVPRLQIRRHAPCATTSRMTSQPSF